MNDKHFVLLKDSLAETASRADPATLFPGFRSFWIPGRGGNQRSKSAHLGSGICALVRKDLSPYVSEWRRDEPLQSLWLRVHRSLLGSARDLMVGLAYIPPRGSKQLEDPGGSVWDRFAAVTRDTAEASTLGNVLLFGDFNGRVLPLEARTAAAHP